MLSSIACNSNEGVLEGTSALNDQVVQYLETRIESQAQAQSFFQGDLKAGVPSNFPDVSLGQDSISFAPNADGLNTFLGIETPSPVDFGDGLNSLVDSAIQMPGGMGILAQLFKFLAALFGNVMQSALDPTLIAQQAQSVLDLKKLMQR